MNKTHTLHGLHTARLVLMLAGSFAAANARDAHTSFGVTATVNAVARMELQSVPTEIRITAEDVRRGFVDVPQPTAFVVRSNSPTGFSLDLATVAPMLESVVVQGLDTELVLGAAGGTVVQRWQNRHVANLSLRFRLVLAPTLVPGLYPWPVQLGVRPLQ